jgi:sporulation protein YqfC
MKKKAAFHIDDLKKVFQFPDDLAQGNTLLSMHGQEHIWIENFRGISLYTGEEIQLLTGRKKLSVSGRHLNIASYTKDTIEITGCIQKLEFL